VSGLDPFVLQRRVKEILAMMPEDGRPVGDRISEAVQLASGELKAERYWSEKGDGPGAPAPFALPLGDFVADKRGAPKPLLGTEDDCILPEHGLGLLIAKGGKGKTTFCVEFALHLASGEDYLGLPVERALNVLMIENEGPREPFRRKLERRLEAWSPQLKGEIYVHDQNWGHARLDLPEFVARLNAFCEEHDVHLVIGDPLDSLGMDGEGSPSETRAMVDRFKAAGLFSARAWFLPHHGRKESVQDAIDEASGAWGGRPDAMLGLEKRKDNQARLSFAKVRWQARERGSYLLDFDPETESFTFVKEEEGEERDYAIEIEDHLTGRAPETAREIATEIGASREKVEEALEAHPDRFDLLTGDAARAAGRRSNSKLWELASPQKPDKPEADFQEVS
jgi:AAA domain